MDKNVLKIIGLLAGLIVLVAAILFIAIKGLNLGIFNAVSIAGIGNKKQEVETAKSELNIAEAQYKVNTQSLENAKKEFETEKEEYELISDETISAIKEATKEEEYFIEYLWITLGNYATAHDLSLAIIEPGGTVSQATTDTATETDDETVSTGTGVTGSEQGVTSTTNAATTGSPTSGTQQNGTQTETTEQETSVTSGLSSSANDLTVQVKGSYMDLADFVFEVENDKSLRFRLDNIKMKSAGGTQVITSFNVKDFTVLKSLE